MCGLYGWSFAVGAKGLGTAQREALASTLSIANAERGDDAYGAYLMRAPGKAEILHKVGSVERAPVAAWGRMPLVMAHTRQATHGAVIPENCHPFQAGSIILSHNGVLANHADLNRKYDRKCVVDSEHIALHLAAGLPLDDIEGYGAISWVNSDEDGAMVRLCRMRNGSLHAFGITLGSGKNAAQVGTIWSSTERHAKRALQAAGLDYFPYKDLEEGHIYEVRGGKLWLTEDRLNLSEPAYIDRRVVNLTCGIKPGKFQWDDYDDVGAGWDGFAYAHGGVQQPDAKERAAIILADDRPASWAQRRADLARELGLTPVNAKVWADAKGERVTAEELDEIMEDSDRSVQ